MSIFLSPRELFPGMTGISRKTWERMQREGRAPAYVRLSPGRVAVRADDFERWYSNPSGWDQKAA